MTKFVEILFGKSWKSSLIGMAGGLILAVTTYAEGRTELGWYVLAGLLPLLGRVIKDANVTGGNVPATPEAQARLGQG